MTEKCEEWKLKFTVIHCGKERDHEGEHEGSIQATSIWRKPGQ